MWFSGNKIGSESCTWCKTLSKYGDSGSDAVQEATGPDSVTLTPYRAGH